MPRLKFPTTFLKDRRTCLELTQAQVAEALEIELPALQKFEQRGEMPEVHFEKLSRVLKISVADLYVEKYAPVIRAVFHIPTESFRAFVEENRETDRALGNRTLSPKNAPAESIVPEDEDLPELFKQVLRRVRKMTPAEGFQSLIACGIYTPDGQLTPEYGGPAKK